MCAQKNKQHVPAKEFGVKVKLGVKDRIVVQQILPKEGNLVALRLIKDITQKTELSQEEMEQIEMKPVPKGGVVWDDKLEKLLGQKTIKFTDAEIGYLKDQIKKLNEIEKIPRETFSLCERIHNLKGKEEREEKEEKEVAPS